MFGLGNNRIKKTLQKTLAECLASLQDELGNVPVEMQTHTIVNAYMLGICEGYAESNNITKPQSIAVIVDAVFEEIYRRESTQVLTTIDQWRNEKNNEFLEAFEKTKAGTTNTLDIEWFKQYATNTFEPANNLML